MVATPEGAGSVTYRLPDRVARTDVSDECVLLDLERGQYYSLNPVGRRMLELLLHEADDSLVVERICHEYDIDAESVRRDLETLIADLTGQGLLEPGDDRPRPGHQHEGT
jgi:hypothetical protein